MLVFRILFCFLVCSPGSLSVLNAQVESTGYASMDTTEYEIEYPDTTLRDNIYIFCNKKGNLSASLEEEVPGDLVFEWSLYDRSIPGFDAPFRTDQGDSSQISELESGGYQVRISNGNGLDTLLRAWVFVNNPAVNAKVVRHDCQVLDLDGIVDIDTFFYYDPFSHEMDTLQSGYDIFWSADPFRPISSERLNPRIWNPPSVKTEYKLTINYHGCQAIDAVSEAPVTTTAGFKLDPLENEAPLEVSFDAGESLNASEYKWYFDYQPGSPEGEAPDEFTTDGHHTYYIPGEYNVLLRTISPSLCEDSLMYPEPVRVYPSELEVPNVFSPDGENGDFLVRAVSMNDFHALIYNRNGRKVYESTDHSEGWDGKINGKLATPGVYFYVITGVGWDDVEYEFTGPLYLYRGR